MDKLKLWAMAGAMLASLLAQPAHANDSTARVGAGGLELVRSDAIRMAEEILEISPTRIRVRYKFLNDSQNDVKTIVAFPMPRFGWNPGEAQLDANVGPMSSFETRVDGQKVNTRVDTKAFLKGKDISALLRAQGYTEKDMVNAMSCNLGAVSGQQCIADSVVKRIPGIAEGGSPRFSVQETAWWEQKFPAGKMVEIEHSYQPKVGQVYQIHNYNYNGKPDDGALLRPWVPGGNSGTEDGRRACTHEGGDDAVISKANRLQKLNDGEVWVTLNDLEYVLGTGRNWKGPIDSFTLRIEKASPDQIVSLCFPGKSRQVDKRTLEFKATRFVPPDDLVVYFYTVKTAGQINREP
jgi:hypothetical protein